MTLCLYKELWVFTLPMKGPCLVALGLLPCPRISGGSRELWVMLSAAAEGAWIISGAFFKVCFLIHLFYLPGERKAVWSKREKGVGMERRGQGRMVLGRGVQEADPFLQSYMYFYTGPGVLISSQI